MNIVKILKNWYTKRVEENRRGEINI